MITARPAAHAGRCKKNGCAHPIIAPTTLIAYYKGELMHAACANLCAGTLTEYAEHEARMQRHRDRHRAIVTTHRARLHTLAEALIAGTRADR